MNSAAVLDLSDSPHAVVRPVPPGRVEVADGFWAERMRGMATHGLFRQFEQCKVTGRLRNFERAAGRLEGDFEGRYYNDSDVYKWLEAASYALAREPSAELRARVDGVIDEDRRRAASGRLHQHVLQRSPHLLALPKPDR